VARGSAFGGKGFLCGPLAQLVEQLTLNLLLLALKSMAYCV
jgi:hypothetical protein